MSLASFGQPLYPWQQEIIDKVMAGETVELGFQWRGRRGGFGLVERFIQAFQLETGEHVHWIGPESTLCINGSCEGADDWRNRG